MNNTTTVSQADYEYAADYYIGFCPHCKDFTRENTEPDASNYECPECSCSDVVGAEQALIELLIDIE